MNLLMLPTLAGCAFSVPLNPALDLPPRTPRIPLTIAVFYSAEFQAYEGVELVRDSRFVRPLGQASVRVFDEALSALFAKVIRVERRPPLHEPEVTAVIEPTIERADFGPPNAGMGWGPAVWAEVTYRIAMYSRAGDPIGSWKVRGMGDAETHAFHELQVLGRATDRAIQDAMTKFVVDFWDVPEVRRWLRTLGVRSPDR